MSKTPDLDKLFEDIEHLRHGVELLKLLWNAVGPHSNFPVPEGHKEDGVDLQKMYGVTPPDVYNRAVAIWADKDPNKVWYKIQEFFDFDDSE